MTALLNLGRYRAGLKVLLPDPALGRAAAEIMRRVLSESGGDPAVFPWVDLARPLALHGVRGRLVQGLQARFDVDAGSLVEGLLADPQEREQLLYHGYAYVGAAVKALPDGGRYLVVLVSTEVVDVDVFRRELFRLVNLYREAKGVSPVRWSEAAGRAAQVRAMEIGDLFEHRRPSGGEWSTILKDLDIRVAEAAENLARGQKDPAEVMEALMGSPGHRENILAASYDQLGVGCQVDASGQLGCAQIFMRR
jgi:uncharacterized protein YkwD